MTVKEPYLDALTRKADAFAELLTLSKGQEALLEAEDPAPLLQLLGRKQEVLRRIEGIDRELASARAAWEARSRDLTRDEAEALIARIRATLEALVACEEEAKRRVESAKGRTLEELSRLRMGRRAADLYRRSSKPGEGGGG